MHMSQLQAFVLINKYCVATDDAPSCEVPSRRRTIKPPKLGKKTIICFKLFFVSVKALLYRFVGFELVSLILLLS